MSQTLLDLAEAYPDAHCELNHKNPFELLVATILSAQCTDARVNLVTPALFARYPTAKAMSTASLSNLEQLIRSTGFYKNKARNLKGMAVVLVKDHGGQVPCDVEALVELPGVGRKTANVVMGNAFTVPSGVVVDTHVTRLATRFGWTESKVAEKIAGELEKVIPREQWIQISHWLIFHGRKCCKARSPLCESCFLFDRCPRRGV